MGFETSISSARLLRHFLSEKASKPPMAYTMGMSSAHPWVLYTAKFQKLTE